MKSKLLLLSLIFILIIPAGCSEKTPSEPGNYNSGPVAALVDYQGCKTEKKEGKYPEIASDRDCIEYSYDPDEQRLELIHINAGFNCCPGDISAHITISNDTITIAERESGQACKCLCLFDLSYQIENLPPSVYTIKVIQLYLQEGDQPLEFTVDLQARQSGKECLVRDHYPWDTGYYSEEPAGVMIDYSGCKSAITEISDVEVPGCLDCVLCLYTGNTLTLKHLNAGFNCCPEELLADITVSNDTIRIVEIETEGLCDCNCLFDLEYEFSNIDPGEYTVIIEEPYRCPEDEPMVFELELPCLPNFCHCEKRSCYPWESSYSEDNDLQRMSEMEIAIYQMLTPPVCQSDGDCMALPYGDKPCGGPGKYVAASRSSEDFERLIPTLSVFNYFQDVVNRRYNYRSDCEYVERPAVECSGGFCRVVR
ncbi:MAG: hypothetical protein GF417_04430 [Candidatus Latescibacteria bacterium]|nr:hypothetical protein [bacterium]MBD3423669.1 hypothetical protein [Candidatus Latescibacterota bacterium]